MEFHVSLGILEKPNFMQAKPQAKAICKTRPKSTLKFKTIFLDLYEREKSFKIHLLNSTP